jgi:hypothetical protein
MPTTTEEGRRWTTQELRGGDAGSVLEVPDTAATLRVSKWSVYNAIRRGELVAVRMGARSTRVTVASVLKVLDND